MKALLVLVLCAAALAVVSAKGSKKEFFESFEKDWESKWVRSKEPKYEGVWKGENNSLVLTSAARHHGISTKFDKAFDFSEDTVIQYEVRFTQTHQCGGAYIKLINAESFKPENFKDDTPYTIMFGPDKCGATDKVHFIFRHKNPITKVVEEKHLKNPPMIMNDLSSHIYTLIVRKDNTYEIYIDQVSKKAGSLLEDFEPSVNPPKEIDDPEDTKPADWVDLAKIPDPEATKPEDWDEEAPRMIADEDAVKPEGWEDDEPEMIADPDAEVPEDWDEETDGEWEAPKIKNPKCEVGCGEWTRPMKPNPAFKGKWTAPLIDNPAYKGPWKARQIPNPNYFEDKEPHKMTPVTGLGIEIWTMQENIVFDNFFLGSGEGALEKAKEISGKTLAAKEAAAEEAAEEAEEETRKEKEEL